MLHEYKQRFLDARKVKLFQAQRTDFYSDIARALLSKSSIGDWLAEAVPRLEANQPNLSSIYREIRDDYLKYGLGQALSKWIPASELTVIVAANDSGALPETLKFLSKTAKKTQKLKNVMVMAGVASTITVAMGLYNFWVVAASLIPMLEGMGVRPEGLTGVSYVMYLTSRWVYDYWMYFVIAMIASVFACIKTLPTWQSELRRKLDHSFIIYKMYREYQCSLFLMAFSIQKSAKQGTKEGLEKISKTAPYWLKWHCKSMLKTHLQYGLSAKMFQSGIFDDRLSSRLGDLCKRGTFDEAIREIGEETLDDTLEFLIGSANWLEIVFGAISTGLMLIVTFGQGPLMEAALKSIR